MPNVVDRLPTVVFALWFLALGYALGWVVYG